MKPNIKENMTSKKRQKRQKNAKNRQKIVCEKCDFVCCKNSDYDKHLSTRKHKMIVNHSKMIVNDSKMISRKNAK